MREVDEAQDAVHHRVADGDQRIDAADLDSNDEQLEEELPLGRVREAVELEHVLPNVEVGVDRDLGSALGLPQRARRRGDQVADSADVDEQAVRRPRDRLAPETGDHAVTFRSGGASAWQTATASASDAWSDISPSSPRIIVTIRCTCPLSARP